MCDQERLDKALKGKSASQGGLNVPELRICAEIYGVDTTGLSRVSLVETIKRYRPMTSSESSKPTKTTKPKAASGSGPRKDKPYAGLDPNVLPSPYVKPTATGDRLSARAYINRYGEKRYGDRCDIRKNNTYKCLVERSNGSPFWTPCPSKRPECGDCSPRCADPEYQ